MTDLADHIEAMERRLDAHPEDQEVRSILADAYAEKGDYGRELLLRWMVKHGRYARNGEGWAYGWAFGQQPDPELRPYQLPEVLHQLVYGWMRLLDVARVLSHFSEWHRRRSELRLLYALQVLDICPGRDAWDLLDELDAGPDTQWLLDGRSKARINHRGMEHLRLTFEGIHATV